MKRVEKLKLPLYEPGMNIKIKLPKKEGDYLIVEYEIKDEHYKIGDCLLIPGNYYKVRDTSDDGTTYLKFNSIDEIGRILTDLSILIWDDEGGRIDGISLEEEDWWDNINGSLIVTPCTETEVKALMFLERKYREIKEKGKLSNDWDITVTDKWTDLIKNNYEE